MHRPTKFQRYFVAVIATWAMFLLRIAVDPWLNGHPTFVLPLLAVLASAWYGGLGPGLVAVALGAGCTTVVVADSTPGLQMPFSMMLPAIILFATTAAIAAALIARLRTTTDKLRATTREAERVSQLLRAAQGAARAGVWAIEEPGAGIYWTSEHYHLYGLDPKTPLSLHVWLEAIHPEDRPLVAQHLQDCLQSGATVDVEFRIVESAELEWRRLSGGPIDGSRQQIAGITIDITRQKVLELELKRSNEDLDRFAYVVAHDLKEPIRMVTAYAQLIERRFGPVFDQDGLEFIGFVRNSAKRMQRMVDGLLALSRAAHDASEQETDVDLNRVLSGVIESLRHRIDPMHAKVTCGQLPVVRGNDVVLTPVFQNVIDNALKYRRPDVPPEIAIESSRRNGFWGIAVRDNGIGFDPAHTPQMFLPFRRLHNARQQEGSGLGLATCKRFIDQMGGEIRAESSASSGATFIISFPSR